MSLRYLNMMLTILAVLLALQIWTAWTTAAPRSSTRVKDFLQYSSVARADGIPNAGMQRKQMLDQLKLQTQKIDDLIKLLKSGQALVRIETPSAEDEGEGNR